LEKKDERLYTVRYELGVGAGGLPPGQAATNDQEEGEVGPPLAHFIKQTKITLQLATGRRGNSLNHQLL
jgi:hypothetical protein